MNYREVITAGIVGGRCLLLVSGNISQGYVCPRNGSSLRVGYQTGQTARRSCLRGDGTCQECETQSHANHQPWKERKSLHKRSSLEMGGARISAANLATMNPGRA